MKKFLVIMTLALVIVWGVGLKCASATYWTPTESGKVDINYVASVDPDASIAIFDNNDNAFSTPLILSSYDTIYFFENSGNWDLKRNADGSGSSLLTLTGDSQFQLAFRENSASNWVTDDGFIYRSPGVYSVYWKDGNGETQASITQIDAEPSVPIPAAVWLLGSGLLGLVGIRRRSKLK